MIMIKDLTVTFEGVPAVENISFEIKDGEILGVVGESGSGKSVTALTVMGLINEEARLSGGNVVFDGEELIKDGHTAQGYIFRGFQGNRMAMVFQEPLTSLNPTRRVGEQVEEMLLLHTHMNKAQMRERVKESFADVALPEPGKLYDKFPHELSGGMRQRVMIAMATILRPDLIIADEPTTALDVTVQNQIMELFAGIHGKYGASILFITHDLNLARRLCHRILVMREGKIVESGETEEIFSHPKEAYTRNLIEAVPSRMHREKHTVVGKAPILTVKDLSVCYRASGNSLFSGRDKVEIVHNASFEIHEAEVVGLVGESGCGKTTLSKALLGINRLTTGEIKHYSEFPQMIFQDPYSSLNPAKTIGWLLMEPVRALGKRVPERAKSADDMRAMAYDMLKKVELPEKVFDLYPGVLSGGMRQRVSIAQALITEPSFVVADEPVSALDVTIQAEVMKLMLRLKDEMRLSYLFISHDINVVYQMCDRIMVMKDGVIVEQGETEEIFAHPKDEYTKLLLA
mgnify:CR=1 FL=1